MIELAFKHRLKPRSRPFDVAIVGMACRFPGVGGLGAFWKQLLDDAPSSSVPRPDAGPARIIEEALDDAGLPRQSWNDPTLSITLAAAGQSPNGLSREHLARLVAEQTIGVLRTIHPDWDETRFRAIEEELLSKASTAFPELDDPRVNYVAATWGDASSLLAVEIAATALVDRKADVAIAGAVAGRSEGREPGAAVVVLRRLRDAEREKERIYAVIQGVGIAADSRATQRSRASARPFARALRMAYQQAGIDPATLDVLERQATGSKGAASAESRALRSVFPPCSRGSRRLASRWNGISQGAGLSAMAGLIKTALSLHHRVIPASSAARDVSSRLSDDQGAPFTANESLIPWIHGRPERLRRAGINAIGEPGAYAHVVLEEHPASADGAASRGCMLDWESEAILLGAPDREVWLDVARALRSWLETGRNADVSLKDLAYTLNSGQSAFPFRVGLVVRSTTELRERLGLLIARLSDPKCGTIREANGTYFWSEPLAEGGKLAFLFPGEGSQYPGMLADLCPHFPELRAVFDTADRVARDRGQVRVPSEQLFGQAEGGGEAGLWAIETAVNVVLTSQWAINQLLRKLKIRPDAVLGHSSGEFLALASAGVIENDRALEDRLGDLGVVFERLEQTGAIPESTLVAVASERSKVLDACRRAGLAVELAIDNCPHQVVIAASIANAAEVVATLKGQGFLCEVLPFNRAYHTPRFTQALEPLRGFFKTLSLKRPTLSLYSCASTRKAEGDVEAIRKLAIDQWVSTVDFRGTVESMYADGVRLFVEVGARGNLAGFVEDTLRGRPHFAIAANLPRRAGVTQINHLVAALFAQGVRLSTDHLYARRRPEKVDLSIDLPALPESTRQPRPALSEGLVERLRSDGGVATPIEPERASIDKVAAASSRTRDEPGGSSRGLDEAGMLSFFETMDAFLETQRVAMGSYLNSRGGVATVETAAGVVEAKPKAGVEPAAVATAKARQVEIAPRFEVEETGPVPMKTSPVELVLDQVGRRTGYPREMLLLEYDMEGDLGIDSIKRAEILGELMNLGVVPDGIEVDELARCKTLGSLVALLKPVADAAVLETVADVPVWVGDVVRYEPGRELVAIRWIDPKDDPVAAHHTLGGRRISAIEPERLGLPVLPFTVMAELIAQAAAVLRPGMVVVGLKGVQANRWIPYEARPVALECTARVEEGRADEVRVVIRNLGQDPAAKTGREDVAVEGVVVFGTTRRTPPVAEDFRVEGSGRCRLSAEDLYAEQWLFHGPALQALTHVGTTSRDGIEGTLRVLPRRELLPERLWPTLHTDPIVLDAFTHLLGGWGIDKRAGDEGDVMFPLRLGMLTLYDREPGEGAEVACRIAVTEISRHRVKVHADIVDADGRLWMRIDDWEDWRFYWPGRYRDVFRAPDRVLISELIASPQRETATNPSHVLVWLEPPLDMLKPVWREVLEWVQLAPLERAETVSTANGTRVDAIWRRIAAKDAARRIWRSRGEGDVFPADLIVETSAEGGSRVKALDAGRDLKGVATAFASREGVAIASATLDDATMIGVSVREIHDVGVLDESEQAWLEGVVKTAEERLEWSARLIAAREAMERAIPWATGLAIAAVDLASGVVTYQTFADGRVATAVTAKRRQHVWASVAFSGTSHE